MRENDSHFYLHTDMALHRLMSNQNGAHVDQTRSLLMQTEQRRCLHRVALSNHTSIHQEFVLINVSIAERSLFFLIERYLTAHQNRQPQ